MNTKFLKPVLGVFCSIAFFASSLSYATNVETVSTDKVEVKEAPGFGVTSYIADQWTFVSSGYVYTGS